MKTGIYFSLTTVVLLFDTEYLFLVHYYLKYSFIKTLDLFNVFQSIKPYNYMPS